MREREAGPTRAPSLAILDQAAGSYGLFLACGSFLELETAPPADDTDLPNFVTSHSHHLSDYDGLIIIEKRGARQSASRSLLFGDLPVYVLPVDHIIKDAVAAGVDRFISIDVRADCVTATLLARTACDDLVRASNPMPISNTAASSDGELSTFLEFARRGGYGHLVITGSAGYPSLRRRIDTAGFDSVWLTPSETHRIARVRVARGFDDDSIVVNRDGRTPGLRMAVTQRCSFVVEHSAAPIFDLENDVLAEAVGTRDCYIVVDAAVDKIYGARLEAYARQRLACRSIVTIDVEERNKTLQSVAHLCKVASDGEIRRDGVIVGCGGGVLLDLVGMAAAVYRRGTDYLRVPTTLVGMIDVCVGIKQGVNFNGKKNLLGSFYAPIGGINDRSFLATLSPKNLSAGFAEIIKVALLLDPELFALLERFGGGLLRTKFQGNDRIANEVLIRAEYVMMTQLRANLWERDLRRPVDFGHTFSSILETESGFWLSHGFAVALDMLVSTAIAIELELCAPDLLERLVSLFQAVELPVDHFLLESNRLLRALPPTRQHRGGNLNLVVPTSLGSGAYVQDVTLDLLDSALHRMRLCAARQSGHSTVAPVLELLA